MSCLFQTKVFSSCYLKSHSGIDVMKASWPLACESNDRFIRKFERHSSRLFEGQDTHLYFAQIADDGDIKEVNSAIGLETDLTGLGSSGLSSSLLIIPQAYSWGRFRITRDNFEHLMVCLDVFPSFVDSICAFGFRTCDHPYAWSGFAIQKITLDERDFTEICYNIEGVEKNGRGRGDPWSIRRLGVYAKHTVSESRWMFLQAGNTINKELSSLIEQTAGKILYCDTLAFHLAVLRSKAGGWDEYLDHLHISLLEFDNKAGFARLNYKEGPDYSVAFEDCQRLHRLHNKLSRVMFILTSNRTLALKLMEHSPEIPQPHCSGVSKLKVVKEFESYRDDIHLLIARLQSMLDRSNKTSQLLSRVVDLREADVGRGVQEAMRKHLDDIRLDTSKNTHFSIKSQGDAAMTKVLTIIATMYLPASLMATIFSSNLITTEKNTDNSGNHFVVASQFWWFILITALVSGLTVASSMWLRSGRSRACW